LSNRKIAVLEAAEMAERRGKLDVAIARLLPTHFAADACCSSGCGFGRLGGGNPWLFTESQRKNRLNK